MIQQNGRLLRIRIKSSAISMSGRGHPGEKRAEARFRQGAWRTSLQRPMHDSLANDTCHPVRRTFLPRSESADYLAFAIPIPPSRANRTTAPPRGKTRVYFHLGTLLTCQSSLAAEARGTSIFLLPGLPLSGICLMTDGEALSAADW